MKTTRGMWIAGLTGLAALLVGGVAWATSKTSAPTPTPTPPPPPPPPPSPTPSPFGASWAPVTPPAVTQGGTFRASFDAAPGVDIKSWVSGLLNNVSLRVYAPGGSLPSDWPPNDVATPAGAATWRFEFVSPVTRSLPSVSGYGVRVWRKQLGM